MNCVKGGDQRSDRARLIDAISWKETYPTTMAAGMGGEKADRRVRSSISDGGGGTYYSHEQPHSWHSSQSLTRDTQLPHASCYAIVDYRAKEARRR